MLRILKKSFKTGIVTSDYPARSAVPGEGFRGLPEISREKCSQCGKCADRCPTKAITLGQTGSVGQAGSAGQTGSKGQEDFWTIDAKRCLFCGYCEDACDTGALSLGRQFELAERVSQERVDQAFGRSVHIRHLDAGSCNGCDWEMAALTGPVYDVQRFGFDFVASPRHADILMVTGPVTRNLEIAVEKTYAATPAPKLVAAVGTCACSGGICGKSFASKGGVDNVLAVDVYIPGCPPRPQALIDGLRKAVRKK